MKMPYKFEVTINYPDEQVSSHGQYRTWISNQIGESNFRKLSEFLENDQARTDVKVNRNDNTSAMSMTRMYSSQEDANKARTAIAGYLISLGSKATVGTAVKMTQQEFDSVNSNYITR